MGGSGTGGWPSVDGYELTRLIGRGGFGSVYEARQIAIGRTVAVKVLPGTAFGEDAERRFRSESRAIGSLSWHPHVVSLFDAGTTSDEGLYLAMEYVTGGSLAVLVRQHGPLAPGLAARIGIEIADALAAAHEAGVLHRDVKPDNVLVDQEGRHLLSDFGIATLDDGTRSTTGTFTGTYAYTAPELLQGERATPQSDVYSLGATLYALVAGQSAYANSTDSTPAAILVRILTQPPAALPSTVPSALAEVIEAAMSKDPSLRPASARALKASLEGVIASLAAADETTERVTPAVLPQEGGAPAEEESEAADVTIARPDPSPNRLLPIAPSSSEAVTEPDPTTDVATDVEEGSTDPYATILSPGTSPRPGPDETHDGDGAGASGDVPRARANRRRAVVAVVAVAAVVTVAVAAFALRGGDGDRTASGSDGRSNAATDTTTRRTTSTTRATTTTAPTTTTTFAPNTVVDAMPVGSESMVFGAASLWSVGQDEVARIDPETNRVIATVPVGDFPIGIGGDDESIWTANTGDGTVSHIDPATDETVASIPVGDFGNAGYVAMLDGDAWVTVEGSGKVVRLDPATNAVTATVPVPGLPYGIGAGGGAVWVGNASDNRISKINPSTNRVVAQSGPDRKTTALAFGDGSVWACGNADEGGYGVVERIDPTTLEPIATIRVGGAPWAFAFTEGAVWVATEDGLNRIDLASNKVVATADAGNVRSAASGAGAVWAGTGVDVVKVQP